MAQQAGLERVYGPGRAEPVLYVGVYQCVVEQGADKTAIILRRLLRYMERKGVHVAVPRAPEGFQTETQAMWKLSSTYALAAEDNLPKYGSDGPWRPGRSVIPDLLHAKWGNITKGLQLL